MKYGRDLQGDVWRRSSHRPPTQILLPKGGEPLDPYTLEHRIGLEPIAFWLEARHSTNDELTVLNFLGAGKIRPNPLDSLNWTTFCRYLPR